MTGRDDLTGDMAFLSSTDRSERLIAGLTPGADLPDESARVARLLTALRSPTASDGAGEQEAVASIVAAIAAAPTSLDTVRSSRMLSKVLTAKVAVVAGAVFLMGTGAAAATGTLPAPAQRVVSDALDRVDVSVPHPDDHADDHAGGNPSSHGADARGTAVGPDATGPAMRGLCTAWAARGKGDTDRGKSGDSVAFTNLRHTAHDAGMFVKDYCHDVLTDEHPTPRSPGTSRSPADDAGKRGDTHPSGGKGSEGNAASDEHAPAVDVPNPGGIDTGATASDGANDTGREHSAPPASGGSSNSSGQPRSAHATGN